MIDICTGDIVGDTPAFKLICEGFNAIVQQDFFVNRGGFPIKPDDDVIYARDGNEIVGVLTFTYRRDMGMLYVTLAYVEPASREQGIFKQLWSALHVEARNIGCTLIYADTHVNNTTMQQALKRVSAHQDGVIFVQPVGA